MTDAAAVPKWAVAAAWTAVVAALPTVLWRALVGLGLDLGTPGSWRAAQDIPGAGTAYVLSLSALQLFAALLTLRLVRAGQDVVPRWSPAGAGRRLPTAVVVATALAGAVALTAVCVLSIRNWSAVDPFAGQPSSLWSKLGGGCYLAALVWPPALVTTVVGYIVGRHRQGRRGTAGMLNAA